MKENITKKQHIITASYIAQFSSLKEKKIRESKIFYYDKRSKKIIENKAENILYEDWYFEIDSSIIDIPNKVNLVENKKGELETNFLKIVNSRDDFEHINVDEQNIILHYMLCLYMGCPKKRRIISEELSKKMDKKYQNPEDIANHKKFLEEN